MCVQALKCVVLYLVLAPYGNEQSDLIHRVKEDKCLEQIPKYRYQAASVFTTLESSFYLSTLSSLPSFPLFSPSPLLLLLLVAALLGGGGGGGPFPLVPLPTPQGGSVSEQSLAGLLRREVVVVVVVVVTQLVVLETGARVFVHVDDAFLQVSLVF